MISRYKVACIRIICQFPARSNTVWPTRLSRIHLALNATTRAKKSACPRTLTMTRTVTMSSTPQLVNRCNESKSPYVRSHASNPTAWQLWCPETLELAKQTNRLIFVSIGYSACHWCHVMADESFQNPHIAELLNTDFIPIKIDREERPDIDRVYMDFLQAATGGGGWPLNVFITPDLEPIYGGTYWPGPNSGRAGMGGTFDQILAKIGQAWKEQEGRCRENAAEISAQLRQFAQEGTLSAKRMSRGRMFEASEQAATPELELLEEAYQHYAGRYDEKHGGFGPAPKFPTPTHLSFLLRLGQWHSTASDIVGADVITRAQEMACKTLEKMALGGINDQIDKGFARYSVTRDWSLPHFEKMLYDNAQLLPVYLDAWLQTKSELFLSTALSIANYMTSPPILSPVGGFNSSEDADSAPSNDSNEHKEGAFYVWTAEEFRHAIGDERIAKLAARYWKVQDQGNVNATHDPQGELERANTLCVCCSTEELANESGIPLREVETAINAARSRLLSYRHHHRPRPHLDDKIVVAWNGLAISGLARLYGALASTIHHTRAAEYLEAAQNAAAFIRKELYDKTTHSLLRVYREGPGSVPGFADDYAHLIAGLIELYEATFDDSYLSWAADLQEKQIAEFYDNGSGGAESSLGGFFSTSSKAADILIRSKDAMDNAEPSTNGVSVYNLFRLGSLLENQRFTDLANETVKAFEIEISQHPGLFTGLLGGAIMARLGVRGLLVSGEGPGAQSAVDELRQSLRPGTTLLRVGGQAKTGFLQSTNKLVRGLDTSRDMIQLCEGTQCRLIEPGGVLDALQSAASV